MKPGTDFTVSMTRAELQEALKETTRQRDEAVRQRDELLSSLKVLLPFTGELQDEGPEGEGWKSEELKESISRCEKAISSVEKSVTNP